VSDVSMRTMSGFEALRRLKLQSPQSRVILLTMHDDPQMAVEALNAGASGFVLKESTGEELVSAINEVLQGRTYLSPAITGDVIALMSEPAGPGIQLTTRQRDVLRLVAEGRRMKEVAANLEISTRTAETIKYDLMRTLNLHSTADLVRYAIQHRLVEL
jgi:DNA-binding NarL/FixJ family response regulator